MDVDASLRRHSAARTAWLDAAIHRLDALPEVAAVLAYGSLGRDEADAWSDVDLIVVLNDDALERSVGDRLEFPRSFGDPLYVLDSTWNAPIDGAQVNVLYPVGSIIPLYVDWNLWPARLVTRVPETVRVIIERDPRRPRGGSTSDLLSFERQPRTARGEMAPAAIRHAWFGMVPIAAKFIARGAIDRATRLLSGIGAEVPDTATRHELLNILRERFTTLGVDQEAKTLAAVDGLLTFVAEVLQAESE